MKRAGRIVHRLLSGLSLLLLLATAGVWVRSYWVRDRLYWFDWPQDLSFLDHKLIICSRGGIQFWVERMRNVDVYWYPAHRRQFLLERDHATGYPDFGDDWDKNISPQSPRYAALGFEWIPQAVPPGWFRDRSVNPRQTDLEFYITSLTLPLYFPTLLFAILPAHYLLRVRRRRRIARRIAQGCCSACGYDLRASSGRCPECGREAFQK